MRTTHLCAMLTNSPARTVKLSVPNAFEKSLHRQESLEFTITRVEYSKEQTMSDGREEREEQEWRRGQEERLDRPEQYLDRVDRDLQDRWKPERKES